ncbi:MAG: hypothetical protein LQ341_001597 [Variospora aurantia]|nr:MAG: hypothetical protein LQ341_001597 [Variospora aurantia]
MNGTPRLRSAYPSTPQARQRRDGQYGTASGVSLPKVPLPKESTAQPDAQAPLIPFNLVDAPSQRFYVAFFYLALLIWRLCDYYVLVSDETDSFQLFMKWVVIDGVVLYGLPGLRIPWLQWSSTTMTVVFALHAIADYILMFRVSIPLEAWLIAFTRLFYDRELAVSERRVKVANVLNNASLILGKQIIHILPEGYGSETFRFFRDAHNHRSAMLNPNQTAFCLDALTASVDLPIWINQTNPILIELLRIDVDTNTNETLVIQAKEIQRLKKQAEKQLSNRTPTSPRHLRYPVRRTGLYRLQRVLDESKLEVQRRLSDTLVVHCPSAHVRAVPKIKCIGDLSDFYIQVDATPPIHIKYSKTVNNEENGHAVLSIPPKNPVSPLAHQRTSGALVSKASPNEADVSWARSQSTRISVNESLGINGHWQYLIDEIQDGCGNVVDYGRRRLGNTHRRHASTELPLEQTFSVYERPRAALQGCDSQHALQVPKGKSIHLPLRISSTGSEKVAQSSHRISYLFTPNARVLSNQEHAGDTELASFIFESHGSNYEVHEPGLYTLQSVESSFCAGEILEPSSCLLSNPPEPNVSIETQSIPDRCAGNSIGLLVDLDLTGTPPFRLSYNIRRRGGPVTPKVAESELLHTQLELRPTHSGHYTYEFLGISDSVYQEPRSLRNQNLVLEQDVKPPASARFLDAYPSRKTCIGEPVTLGVQLSGEPPWRLDYELIHHGRRQKHKTIGIESNIHTLATDELKTGGEYSLALSAVTDNSGCKVSLEQETKIEVALQRPKASFGLVEGQRSILALKDRVVKLPLRLQGEPPWTVQYRNIDEPDGGITSAVFKNSNDAIDVVDAGTYELIHVNDGTCPGNVDTGANRFTVKWVPRPGVQVSESAVIEVVRGKHVKKEICEGDEDALEISFTGTPPFDVEYSHDVKPERGSQSSTTKKFTAGINVASLRMESSEAGTHQYQISRISDLSYNHNPRQFSPINIEQRVHARPSAAFVEGGKTYKYCKEEDAGGENVPIALKGEPPFHLEVEVRHHASSKPELVNIPNVDSQKYNLHISHRLLSLGTHTVKIRKVRDAHGCQRQMDQETPRVQVNVAEVPSISALESQTDYCIGDRISYMLAGSPPFSVFYTFNGQERKAAAPTTSFRRLAEKPGEFTINAVADQRSADCKAHTSITKVIHEMPSVRVSKGRTATVDIHEGGEAEIMFEFGGTPPFEFTYTRSSNPQKGKKPQILDTKSDISYEFSKTILASDEGMYEVVAIKDRFCSFSTQKEHGKTGRKLLT